MAKQTGVGGRVGGLGRGGGGKLGVSAKPSINRIAEGVRAAVSSAQTAQRLGNMGWRRGAEAGFKDRFAPKVSLKNDPYRSSPEYRRGVRDGYFAAASESFENSSPVLKKAMREYISSRKSF